MPKHRIRVRLHESLKFEKYPETFDPRKQTYGNDITLYLNQIKTSQNPYKNLSLKSPNNNARCWKLMVVMGTEEDNQPMKVNLGPQGNRGSLPRATIV